MFIFTRKSATDGADSAVLEGEAAL